MSRIVISDRIFLYKSSSDDDVFVFDAGRELTREYGVTLSPDELKAIYDLVFSDKNKPVEMKND